MEVELDFLYSLSIYLSVPPLKVFFFWKRGSGVHQECSCHSSFGVGCAEHLIHCLPKWPPGTHACDVFL